MASYSVDCIYGSICKKHAVSVLSFTMLAIQHACPECLRFNYGCFISQPFNLKNCIPVSFIREFFLRSIVNLTNCKNLSVMFSTSAYNFLALVANLSASTNSPLCILASATCLALTASSLLNSMEELRSKSSHPSSPKSHTKT